MSVIIVTYNSSTVIEVCLDSLAKQTYSDFETLVVDNQSSDQTAEILRARNDIKLVELLENKGFAGGNIEGLKYARGKYIALLNPDTEVTPQWLEKLVIAIEDGPRVGVAASKLVVHNSDIIDSAGDGCTTTGKGYKRGEGENSVNFSEREYVFGACGGAMLVKKELIGEIGFFDDDFFLIHEDTDFCFRAQLAGWKCIFVPEAIVYHRVRTSIGNMSDLAVYYSIRNSKYVLIKNMPGWLLVKYFYQHLIQEIGNFVFFILKKRKFQPYLKGYWDFIRMIPGLLNKRREIKRMRRVSTQEIERSLTPVTQKSYWRQKLRKMYQ
ncbi:MAG: glycosyltransferase family 2 protein [Firmicutes bacterium]|nr:glycosyltransferase family 2 protein [Bacillota bacterium]